MRRNILFIGDTHVGSTSGLWPQNFELTDGTIVKENKLQKELYKFWKILLDETKQCDTVVLLGDIVHGLNAHERGRNVMVSNLNEQMRAAIELLKPICKGKELLAITGTPYHDGIDFNVDQAIVESLGGIFGKVICDIKLKGTKTTINIVHGKGGATMYSGTKMSQEVNFTLMSEALAKTPHADILVRAHFHLFRQYNQDGKLVIWNPAFEGPRRDTYSSGNHYRFQPDIGATELIIDNDVYTVIPHLFKLKSVLQNVVEL